MCFNIIHTIFGFESIEPPSPWRHKVGNHASTLQTDAFVICQRGLNLARSFVQYL